VEGGGEVGTGGGGQGVTLQARAQGIFGGVSRQECSDGMPQTLRSNLPTYHPPSPLSPHPQCPLNCAALLRFPAHWGRHCTEHPSPCTARGASATVAVAVAVPPRGYHGSVGESGERVDTLFLGPWPRARGALACVAPRGSQGPWGE